MSGANVDGVVVEADVRAAQAILDALEEFAATTTTAEEYRAGARGFLASWSADVRTAGYLEGHLVGGRSAARVVRDALEGEGLL